MNCEKWHDQLKGRFLIFNEEGVIRLEGHEGFN